MTMKCHECGQEFPESEIGPFLVNTCASFPDKMASLCIRAYKCPNCNIVLLVKK